MSKITKEELEKLKELYVEQKASYKEMEEYFKVDKKQIYRWIRKHNLPRKVIHCERKTINKEELEELYVKQGKSYEEIEKHFGIKTSVLYRWIKKYDLPLRIKPTKRQLCIRQSHISGETYDASQNMPKVNKEAFEDLYVNQRKSYDEIGVYFDISRAEVYRCVKKYDLPRQIHNIQDLTNQTFGKLKVIKYVESGRYRYLNSETGKYVNGGKFDVWQCECECGKKFGVKNGNLKNGHATQCRECAATQTGNKLRKCPIDYNIWYNIVKRCNKKGMELDITPEHLYELFLKQNGKCALSGVEIHFGKTRRKENTASPDRIDSSKGYIKGNMRWVHKYINTMRNSLPDHLFIEWCQRVVNYSTSAT